MLHYSPKPVCHVPVVSHLSPEGTDTQPLVVASRVVQGLCLPMFGGGELQLVLRRERGWQGVPGWLGLAYPCD